MKKPVDLQADYQPDNFEFQDEDKIQDILGRYPPHGKKSAVMPLLDLAQRQVAETGPFGHLPTGGGWIPRAAMDRIAEILGQPKIKIYEVATFYSMYNLAPVGKYLIQLCTTTPCWLCGSADIVKACEDSLGLNEGETTTDGLFTLFEVECLGACVNAPMVQINDDYYEDLTPERMKEILSALKEGRESDIPAGSQRGRKGSMAEAGPSTLKDDARKAGVIS